MTFVNTKQQKLIEESVTNHVKFYDKTISQYLKFRQELYQLSLNITPDSKTLVKLHQLKLELDKLELLYQLHLQELTNLLKIQPTDYIQDIKDKYESLLTKKDLLSEQINNIETIQQPILSKIQTLVKSFDQNISTRTNYITPRMVKEQTGDSTIDFQALVISNEQIIQMIQETNIDIDLANNRIFDKYSDTEMLYKLNKSNLRELTQDMTVTDYENLIESTISQINTLQQEGNQLELNWNNNAGKIELIKRALE